MCYFFFVFIETFLIAVALRMPNRLFPATEHAPGRNSLLSCPWSCKFHHAVCVSWLGLLFGIRTIYVSQIIRQLSALITVCRLGPFITFKFEFT